MLKTLNFIGESHITFIPIEKVGATLRLVPQGLPFWIGSNICVLKRVLVGTRWKDTLIFIGL
jgi:hypothetical protein